MKGKLGRAYESKIGKTRSGYCGGKLGSCLCSFYSPELTPCFSTAELCRLVVFVVESLYLPIASVFDLLSEVFLEVSKGVNCELHMALLTKH